MNGVQVAALIIMFLGFLLTSIAVGIPYWEKSDPSDTVNDNIVNHKGLWLTCVSYSTGNWECDDFNTFFLGLGTMLQAARGFGVSSMAFAVIGLILAIIGMDGIPCAGDDKSLKRYLRLGAGAASALGGLCIVAAASWYASNIHQEYQFATARKFNQQTSTRRQIFGEALFLGWAGGCLLIFGGLISFCTGCGGGDYEDNSRGYVYRPPVNKHSQEYV